MVEFDTKEGAVIMFFWIFFQINIVFILLCFYIIQRPVFAICLLLAVYSLTLYVVLFFLLFRNDKYEKKQLDQPNLKKMQEELKRIKNNLQLNNFGRMNDEERER